MNAIKFIKEWGLEHSRNYVAIAENDGDILTWEKELKRLVESVDLINSLEGVQEATNKAFDMTMLVVGFNPDKIEQAIADYESIYGGEHV